MAILQNSKAMDGGGDAVLPEQRGWREHALGIWAGGPIWGYRRSLSASGAPVAAAEGRTGRRLKTLGYVTI
jgi:hypothetical protein